MSAQRGEPKVFFPWERRGGLSSAFRRGRARKVLLVLGAIGAFAWLRVVERRVSNVRMTRATITTTVNGVAAWRADHERACPPPLGELVATGYLSALPRDAWGRQLRVTCPGRKDSRGFDVSSDGPDGVPGGLDRIE